MTVAVFYGGKSCEHDVSIITGVQTAKLLDGYDIVPVYIDRGGKWNYVKRYDDVAAYRKGLIKCKKAFMKPGDDYLYLNGGKRFKKIDVAVLCTHGAGGEDGALQGFLQLCGVAYTGSGIAASAIGMDKILAKKMFVSAGLNVTDYFVIKRSEYENTLPGVVERAKEAGYPLMIKPACLGSSIGICKAANAKELITALNVAFEWDNTVIAEKALSDFTELNCAVLKDGKTHFVSEAEQPLSEDGFLSYADKYERGGLKGAGGRIFPADIDEALKKEVQESAVKAFDAVGASGIARVDFLYDEKEKVLYVNEINTIPGSLALYLFPSGPDGGKEISDKKEKLTEKNKNSFNAAKYGEGNVEALKLLIAAAVYERDARERLRYKYESAVLHSKG